MVEHDDGQAPEDFDEHEDFSDIEALFGEHRDAVDPGEHFFEALEQDILQDVASKPQGDQPVQAAPPVAPERKMGWLARLFAERPGVAAAGAFGALVIIGFVMIVPIVVASRAQLPSGVEQPAVETPEIAVRITEDPAEVAALVESIGDVDLELDFDAFETLDALDPADAALGQSVVGAVGTMSEEELDAFEEELERLL